MNEMRLRTLTAEDRSELAELIYVSLNFWYQMHGRPAIFSGDTREAEIFGDVYGVLDPDCCVVAENTRTGRLMGSCFYHPRRHHVSLGIMNVHPNYFGRGVARALLQYVIDYTERGGFQALRLIQSALNLDSFSLYTKAGFVPRCAYQDMLVPVPPDGVSVSSEAARFVRPATLADVPAMAALEMEISGIEREQDYRYFTEDPQGFWRISVYEDSSGRLEGFLASSDHPAINVLGPGVARSEREAEALILSELNRYRGRLPMVLVPVECQSLVRRMYALGARNNELHFCQVRGRFQPFQGVTLPTFLPETG
jgi:GNAT superfamily N-acetyltransferase